MLDEVNKGDMVVLLVPSHQESFGFNSKPGPLLFNIMHIGLNDCGWLLIEPCDELVTCTQPSSWR